MKARITKLGHLELFRSNKYRVQICPQHNYSANDKVYCGDWCPLFGEPYEVDQTPSPMGMPSGIIESIDINLCRKTITCRPPENFKDLRRKENGVMRNPWVNPAVDDIFTFTPIDLDRKLIIDHVSKNAVAYRVVDSRGWVFGKSCTSPSIWESFSGIKGSWAFSS